MIRSDELIETVDGKKPVSEVAELMLVADCLGGFKPLTKIETIIAPEYVQLHVGFRVVRLAPTAKVLTPDGPVEAGKLVKGMTAVTKCGGKLSYTVNGRELAVGYTPKLIESVSQVMQQTTFYRLIGPELLEISGVVVFSN